MSRIVKAGLIGCGSVSVRGILPHLSLPDAKEKIELVAVCDVVEERAKAAAEHFGVPRYYTQSKDLIEQPDIELVLIATPIPYHYPDAMLALNAGKHLYMQKTMSMTLEQANEMVETARAKGLTLVASPGQMLAPTLRKAREVIQSGALGKVYWAFGTTAGSHEHEPLRQGDGPLAAIDPTWYYRAGGGPVYDMTVYMLHNITGVLGPVKRVTAMSGIGQTERRWRDKVIQVEMDDNTMLLLDFGDSVFAMAGGHNCHGGRLLPWGTMGFYGSAGSMEGPQRQLQINSSVALPDLPTNEQGTYIPNDALPYVNELHRDITESHVYADIMHCADCILEGRAPVASGEHAAHVIEIIEKGYIAARTGQTQEIVSSFSIEG
jgi:predicted dehydrogenase